MQPRVKVWIEDEDGRVRLSEWRVALLVAIGEHDSLSVAARVLGVPHRTTWQRVRKMEERLGIRLVETASGGAAGGSTCLTAAAKTFISRYVRMRSGLDEQVQARFLEAFDA